MLKRFTVSRREDRPTNPPLKLISSSLTEVGNQRIYSRSISWNASGSYLAMGSSDRMTRLWTVQDAASSTAAREIVTIAGHGGNVDRVRFHPVQDSLLATASGGDGTVRLWDIRGATSKAVGKLDLSQTSPTPSSQSASTTPITKEKGGANTIQGGVVDIAWSTKPGILAVTDRNGSVHVIDTRKLSAAQAFSVPHCGGSKTTKSISRFSRNSPVLKSFSLRPSFVDACIFSPSTNCLVAATSNDGYGEITVWNWEETDTLTVDEDSDPNKMNTSLKFVYPAHTGPIYSMGFSSDGKRLATGAGDAVVGLWDVSSMACTATMIRCSRFIRSVSFSHDSRLIAVSTEDDVVDIGMSDTGMFVGNVPLSGGRSRTGGGPAGADEIAFHPKYLLLACARCDSVVHPPLTIVKLKTEAI
ncbi:WD40 repeat-containing protein [Nitzschia inconspicua]|uniref:WD40 repeat-containing protein n=1 Tax=Nitzschia inconspicua TaxID=303405 RepID=A0A9K3PHJ4_9STRA|nr:WD40 repeat-containing protein [Nitzschia inconspicua]